MDKAKRTGQPPKQSTAKKPAADKLIKTSKKASVELTEAELDKVAGGAMKHKIAL